MPMTPWSPIQRMSTPCQTNSPASVTTNDGTPTNATNDPCARPIAIPTARAMRIATIPGRSWFEPGTWKYATATPAIPLT